MQAPPAGRTRPHSNASLVMLAVVGIALFVAFVALGVWQVQRLSWKLDLIARVEQRLQAPPRPLPPPAQWPQVNAAAWEYQPVRLQGHWLAGKTVLTQATTALGAGYWVLTPLQLADGAQVLVNRGFVPQNQRAQWQAQSAVPDTQAPAPVTIEGLLRMSEPGGGFLRRNDPAQQRWHSRDVAAMAQALQLPHTAPFFVDAGLPAPQSAASTELPAAAPEPWPRPGLTVVRFSNSHLVYALTWFGLALMVVGAGVAVARYEAHLRKAHRKHPIDEPQH